MKKKYFVSELAGILGYTRAAIYHAIYRGVIKTKSFGPLKYIEAEEAEKWINAPIDPKGRKYHLFPRKKKK